MPSPSSPYNTEVKLRHAGVLGAAWVGYRCAWKGLAGVSNALMKDHPYKLWYPFYEDPAHPNDPAFGVVGKRRWDIWAIVAPDLLTVDGDDLDGDDAFTVHQRKEALEQFFNLPAAQIMVPSGEVVQVRMFNLELYLVEPYDKQHIDGSASVNGEGRCGGWIAHIELVDTTP